MSAERISSDFLAMLVRAVDALAARPAILRSGPDEAALTLGLSSEEVLAVWHVVSNAGCARQPRWGRAKVKPECVRALARALRDMARRDGLRL